MALLDQEEGLAVEDLRVETLERMRRLFILVLLAAQFVWAIGRTWAPVAVWQTAATLAFLANHPFPRATI